MAKRMKRLKTADHSLSDSLTSDLISDLTDVLTQDDSYGAGYLADRLLSKFVTGDAGEALERRHKAIEKWLSVELVNSETNRRLADSGASQSLFSDSRSGGSVSREAFLTKVAGLVRQVIGDTPSLHYSYGGFSGGASTSKTRRHGHPAMKFLDRADVTRRALPLFRDVICGTRWAASLEESGLEPRFVSGNVMFTVPKDDTIDRVAAKEPDLNMFLQKSFGNQIRWLLKRVGVNLNDQTVNQELARIGSITGQLMTVDMSSASDSVTVELVRRVLPPDWFYYLDLVRSTVTSIDGEYHVNEMFSSMGNGFTFELESLLFYSIARACAYYHGVKGTISVYGDDIIAPTELWDPLVEALSFCGFSTNERKSHYTGFFRESCGKHWYGGSDVSPFYLRRPLDRVSDLILILNQLTSWSSRCFGVVDPRYEAIILKYREYVPEHLWGGQDLTSRSSLVTGHKPRKELIWPIEAHPHNHVGGLLFWLFVAEPRRTESLGRDALTTFGSSPPRFARTRVNNQWWTDVPIFLSEYGS